MADRRPSCDLLASLHLLPAGFTPRGSTLVLLTISHASWLGPAPLLPSMCLAGPSRLRRLHAGDSPAPPLLTSADFSSWSPGLPEQAACVLLGGAGGGGRHCDASLLGQAWMPRGWQCDGAWRGGDLVDLHNRALPGLGVGMRVQGQRVVRPTIYPQFRLQNRILPGPTYLGKNTDATIGGILGV